MSNGFVKVFTGNSEMKIKISDIKSATDTNFGVKNGYIVETTDGKRYFTSHEEYRKL